MFGVKLSLPYLCRNSSDTTHIHIDMPLLVKLHLIIVIKKAMKPGLQAPLLSLFLICLALL